MDLLASSVLTGPPQGLLDSPRYFWNLLGSPGLLWHLLGSSGSMCFSKSFIGCKSILSWRGTREIYFLDINTRRQWASKTKRGGRNSTNHGPLSGITRLRFIPSPLPYWGPMKAQTAVILILMFALRWFVSDLLSVMKHSKTLFLLLKMLYLFAQRSKI